MTFGKDKPGGTRISKLSHLDGPKKVPLLVSRGKSAIFTVTTLPDAPPADPNATRITELRNEWKTAGPDRQAEIAAEVKELQS